MKTRLKGLAAMSLSFLALGSVFDSAHSATAQQSPATTASLQSLADGDLLLLGPVDRTDQSKFQVLVLGQLVTIPSNQRFIDVNSLRGQMVAVYGFLKADGTRDVQSISIVTDSIFVPGATSLYFKGVVDSLEPTNAIARFGKLSIIYSGALHTLLEQDLIPGKVAAFSGIEFGDGLTFYADNGLVRELSRSETRAAANSDLPTEVFWQSGTDAKVQPAGQTGTGEKLVSAGQTGTGKKLVPAGQPGTGEKVVPAGQTGTGEKSIPAGQTGTGKKLVPAGQTGTGEKAVPAGQTGTGERLVAAGQTGTGKKLVPAGQTGTGKKAVPAGQTGTGKKFVPAGQTGTGKKLVPNGQTGTGKKLLPAGQTGTGEKSVSS